MLVFKKKDSKPLGFGIEVRQSFAFFPVVVRQPKEGVLWLEFYGKVYQYVNGSWHFIGILHRNFESGKFRDWSDHYHRVYWDKPSLTRKLFYFVRWFLVIFCWVLISFLFVLLVHKYQAL